MIPIFEQGTGKGIGHSLDSFVDRFDKICAEHLATKRASAFAFIFYDFANSGFRRILRDEGVFTKIDRLAGSALSVFYLHSGSRHAIEKFNQSFFLPLVGNGDTQLPCVVFFRIETDKIRDIQVAELTGNLIHGLTELHIALEKYLAAHRAQSESSSRSFRWIRGGAKFVSTEVFRAILRDGLDSIL